MRKILTSTHTRLGSALAFIAGAINAGGFLAVGYYTSHMTGIGSSIGDFIALHQYKAALVAFGLLLSFTAGAITTAVIVNAARAKGIKSEYSPALLLEGVLLLLFCAGASVETSQTGGVTLFAIALLCFVMGLQNAMITKISNATIRTTHITGLITDIGIEIGRKLYVHCSKDKQVVASSGRLGMYIFLVAAFLIGGILGAIFYKAYGAITTLPLALLVLFLAYDMKQA